MINAKISCPTRVHAYWLRTLLAAAMVGGMSSQPSLLHAASSPNPHGIYQQNGKVKGVVKDSQGEPIIGATVTIPGTSAAAITDIDGNFEIEVPAGAKQLKVTYIGFQDKLVPVKPGMQLDIALSEDNKALDEVVVVGYGTQRKATLTGAIETVNGAALESRAITNVGAALQGQTPGLVVTRSSSRPGNEGLNFTIRGATSVNGGSPLIVIDGVPAMDNAAFNNLNSDDIETISVLKDGSASIYGAKAANGVILVTTKKGKGKARVDYNFNMRFTTPGITAFAPNMKDYARLWLEANKEETVPNWWGWLSEENVQKMASGYEGIYTTQYWGDVFLGNANRMDELFATRYSYQHNFSVSGSTEKSNYRISAEYADNQGNLAVAYDGQKQLDLRLNYGIQLTDWLKVETSTSMINTKTKTPSVPLDVSMYAFDAPVFPAKNPYGQWYANFGSVGDRQSVASLSDGGTDKRNNLLTRLDLKATADIWKAQGIQVELMASFQNQEYRREKYIIPVRTYDWFGNPAQNEVTNATLQSVTNPGYQDWSNNSLYQYYSALLRWDRTFNKKHKVAVMAGINAEKTDYKNLWASREIFDAEGVYDLNLGEGEERNSGGKSHNGTFSYIAKVNYSYADRYLLEFMGRRDGNSKFAAGHRFKNFGSFSAGWVFTEEAFAKPITSILNFGKLRISYGSSGNDVGLGNYDYTSTISQGQSVLGYPAQRYTSTSLSNAGLISLTRTWEKVEQKNIGIDLHFLDSRLTSSFDYFIKDNKGMLTNVTYPSVLGGTAPKTNSGHLNVKGWEVMLSWKDHIADFNYNLSFNMSNTKTKLKEMEGADTYGAGRNATVNGYPLNSWFVYRTDGYFKDQAEVDRYYALYGAKGGSLSNVMQGSVQALRPGDTKRIDLNGDRMITANGSTESDLQFVGDGDPHYVFGFGLGASWKGFDLNAFFQGAAKQLIMRSGYMNYPFHTQYTNQNTKFLGKTWTEDNPTARYPRLTSYPAHAAWNYENNDFMLQNNRYLRLKSLVVGYSLPQKWINRIGVQKLRVYFSGEDLWEATSIQDGFDPEMGEASNSSGYPFARTWSFGVNVGF